MRRRGAAEPCGCFLVDSCLYILAQLDIRFLMSTTKWRGRLKYNNAFFIQCRIMAIMRPRGNALFHQVA